MVVGDGLLGKWAGAWGLGGSKSFLTLKPNLDASRAPRQLGDGCVAAAAAAAAAAVDCLSAGGWVGLAAFLDGPSAAARRWLPLLLQLRPLYPPGIMRPPAAKPPLPLPLPPPLPLPVPGPLPPLPPPLATGVRADAGAVVVAVIRGVVLVVVVLLLVVGLPRRFYCYRRLSSPLGGACWLAVCISSSSTRSGK